jgi:hypothetical protein
MLGFLGGSAELIGDMVDVEVYKCEEKVEWPSFTLSDVHTMNELRVRGRSDSRKCTIACIRPHRFVCHREKYWDLHGECRS